MLIGVILSCTLVGKMLKSYYIFEDGYGFVREESLPIALGDVSLITQVDEDWNVIPFVSI